MSLRYKLQDAARFVQEFVQDQWFDATRRVRTAGNMTLRRAGIARPADSEFYMPARPWQVRYALATAVPAATAHAYAYVDLGSGKGRSLFVAAEWPFREVVGVEFSPLLHERAVANVATYRHRGRRCGPIRPVHADAADFAFPDGPLVVYLFNPFGADTTRRVFANLAASLQRQPRHAVVVLLWPRQGDVVAAVPGMQLTAHPVPWLQVFEAHRPCPPTPPPLE